MDDKKNLPTKEPVKYATPMQRLWAWVGVVYMVALVLLTTYALSHGRYLQGIGSLMVSPALGAGRGSAPPAGAAASGTRAPPRVSSMVKSCKDSRIVWAVLRSKQAIRS